MLVVSFDGTLSYRQDSSRNPPLLQICPLLVWWGINRSDTTNVSSRLVRLLDEISTIFHTSSPEFGELEPGRFESRQTRGMPDIHSRKMSLRASDSKSPPRLAVAVEARAKGYLSAPEFRLTFSALCRRGAYFVVSAFRDENDFVEKACLDRERQWQSKAIINPSPSEQRFLSMRWE